MRSAVVQGGKFEVFENGDVYRINKDSTKTKCTITNTGKNKNYKTVSCQVDGKQKNFYVHRLVAEAFIPNPLNLPQVYHLDGNPANNDIKNLKWCTPKDCINLSYASGKLHPLNNAEPCKICGTATNAKDGICPACKLSQKQAKKEEARVDKLQEDLACIDLNGLNEKEKEIVKMRISGMTLQEIGDVYGYTREYIRTIIERAKLKSKSQLPVTYKRTKVVKQEVYKLGNKIAKKKECLEIAELKVLQLKNELVALEANYALLTAQKEA